VARIGQFGTERRWSDDSSPAEDRGQRGEAGGRGVDGTRVGRRMRRGRQLGGVANSARPSAVDSRPVAIPAAASGIGDRGGPLLGPKAKIHPDFPFSV
jgi:hypothetical protein